MSFVCRITMLFCRLIMFDLKCTVYEIYICLLHILKTSLFSVNSFALCATEQLVQGTSQLFLSLQGCHVITKVIPPVNLGVSVALRVMLMRFWTIRHSIYSVVQENSFLLVWKMQYVA
jgi:hypothetical protein